MSTEIIDLGGGSSTADDLSENGKPDNEFRSLIYAALDNKGFLSRFKAQLRAAVFNVVETPNSNSSDLFLNDQIGRTIVLDWLEKNQLHFTLDVFKAETSGPRNPAPIETKKLFEQIGLPTINNENQTILKSILQQKVSNSFQIDELPDSIRKSIDQNFNETSQLDSERFRDHFHSLFGSNFDRTVLDAFLDQNLNEKITKQQYEQISLKWIRSCAAAISPNVATNSSTRAVPFHESPSLVPSSVTPSRRSGSVSNDSSDMSSSSETNARKKLYEFSLPSPAKNKSIISPVKQNRSPLIDLDDDDDDDDDASEHNFSERNVTDAQRAALQKIEQIANGDETPRTRTTINRAALKNTRSDQVEYEDESFSVSQSMMSSVDDVTVDKISPYSTIQLDYVETL